MTTTTDRPTRTLAELHAELSALIDGPMPHSSDDWAEEFDVMAALWAEVSSAVHREWPASDSPAHRLLLIAAGQARGAAVLSAATRRGMAAAERRAQASTAT